MKKGLLVALVLVVAGAALFVIVMMKNKWDFTKLRTNAFETNVYEISQDFTGISMDSTTADISFELSGDGKCKVECYEDTKEKHSVAVENGTLVIQVNRDKAWYDYIGINFDTPKIKVSLPKEEYRSLFLCEDTGDIEIPGNFQFQSVEIALHTGDVAFSADVSGDGIIKTTTGDIFVENVSARNLELTASTGHIQASNVTCSGDVTTKVSTGKVALMHMTCENLTSSGSTGDLLMNDVVARQIVSVKRSTGDVKFDRCDGQKIYIQTDTGDVEGSLLTEKIFAASSDTGDVEVPKTTTGGYCEVTTDTGDIEITIH